MEYVIPICWPSVSKIVRKHRGTRFHTADVIVRQGATVNKVGGAYR